ncbi:MAG: glycerol-3-phosphate 1-O-acyltransferase PlsY [Christensenellaceae bacterium]|jgi:glycerol-3-phosphate acyltransferase PlsY|nr:glycerol-3-phosphate 1-O-acyltransferase PlsY [Christensenellaceae bacterium]
MYIDPIKLYLLCLLLGYLLGNIQFAVLFSRLLYHDDVRAHGSGNAGSTNMLRVFGVGSGILTFAGDFLKGVAAVLVGRSLGGDHAACAMALGVVLGHDFPALLKFHGGKGVASTMGVLWAFHPLFGAIVTVVGVGLAAYSRMISLGSMAGALLLLVLMLIWGADSWQRWLAVALCLLLFIRHAENIVRIKNGTEGRITFHKK